MIGFGEKDPQATLLGNSTDFSFLNLVESPMLWSEILT